MTSFDLFKPRQPPTPEPAEIILLNSQLEAASPQHAEWALKYCLQLELDGLPKEIAAKQTSFKFFGSYS